ncbi:hypothetical protein BpHYR1_014611, partial [Brachionus plicatilis]
KLIFTFSERFFKRNLFMNFKKIFSNPSKKSVSTVPDNLDNTLNQTTVTRSTRLKQQQKLLESLACNENESSESDSEECAHFDEFLDTQSNSQQDSHIGNDSNNDKSIYESAESESNSVSSDIEYTNPESEWDNQTNASDQSYSEFLSLGSDDPESLDGQDLELKRKELERQAKRLIRKKQKLSCKILNSDCMLSNSDSFGEPVRKSLRKRTLCNKLASGPLADDQYSAGDRACKHE